MRKPDRSWIEIDTEALKGNIKTIQTKIGTAKIMAIVKDNAYGIGIESAIIMQEMGIDFFGVACIQEAIELRKIGIVEDILILGETDYMEMRYLSQYDLIQTITSLEYAEELSKMNENRLLKIRCHLKVDTGMHRNGVEQLEEMKKIYQMSNILVEGIYTHLSVADEMTELAQKQTKKQLHRFLEVLEELSKQGIKYGKTHALNSAGISNYGNYVFDYVRPGLLLYGFGNKLEVKEVLSVKSRITLLREVQAGEYVGYGLSEIVNKPVKIAKIPIGYGDGLDRRLTHSNIVINQQNCSILGRICMDQLIVDVTDLTCQIGDEVDVIPRVGGIQRIAKELGTIENEVLVRLNTRLKRVYL